MDFTVQMQVILLFMCYDLICCLCFYLVHTYCSLSESHWDLGYMDWTKSTKATNESREELKEDVLGLNLLRPPTILERSSRKMVLGLNLLKPPTNLERGPRKVF